MTRVLGLDLSLTATGYAYNEEVVGVFRTKAKGPRRLVEISEYVAELALEADVVVLEGYAMGRANAHTHAIGELGGVVRVRLWQRRTPYVEVPPAVLKKFATGKGNADKGAMIAAAIRRFGFEGDNDNAADAWLLRAMGLAAYDGRPPLHGGKAIALEALSRIEWPRLEVSA